MASSWAAGKSAGRERWDLSGSALMRDDQGDSGFAWGKRKATASGEGYCGLMKLDYSWSISSWLRGGWVGVRWGLRRGRGESNHMELFRMIEMMGRDAITEERFYNFRAQSVNPYYIQINIIKLHYLRAYTHKIAIKEHWLPLQHPNTPTIANYHS